MDLYKSIAFLTKKNKIQKFPKKKRKEKNELEIRMQKGKYI